MFRKALVQIRAKIGCALRIRKIGASARSTLGKLPGRVLGVREVKLGHFGLLKEDFLPDLPAGRNFIQNALFFGRILGYPCSKRRTCPMQNMLPNLLAHFNQWLAVLGAMLLLIWQELRDKRKHLRLTIERAAELCGVDPSTYARWERGKQFPHLRNLNMLMKKIDPYEEWDVGVPDAWLPPSYWND
jgi:DNA-binding XRE family transcriptional regulator